MAPDQPARPRQLWLDDESEGEGPGIMTDAGGYVDPAENALGQLVSLPVLQDKIKRSPQSYTDDFQAQYTAFLAEMELFEAAPQKPNRKFEELTMFMAQVSGFFGKADEVSDSLQRLLVTHLAVARILHLKLVLNALCVMDNNNRIDRTKLYEGWFELLSSENEDIPMLIVKQLIKSFASMKNHQDKKLWQRTVIANMKKAKTVIATRRFQYILITLYVKGTWADSTTANMIAEGMFDKSLKIVEYAARFILGDLRRLNITVSETKRDVEVDEAQQRQKQAELVARITQEISHTNRKKSKSLAKVQRMKETAEKELGKLENRGQINESLPFQVMYHLTNPQMLVERLYKRITCDGGNKLTYKCKLLLFTVSARLMGKFEIVIPGFFTSFEKYIRPAQPQVTRVLAVLAQAVHENSPVAELQQMTRIVADQFVNDSQSRAVITVGLNTIREMCTRNIQCLTPELLADLILVAKGAHDNSTSIAGKSLRNLYRLRAPEMLARRDRGKSAAGSKLLQNISLEDPSVASSSIPGLDVLIKLKIAAARQKHCKQPDEAELLEEVRKIQTQRVLTDADFAALRKIRQKVAAAASMNVTLKTWLETNPETVEDLATQILGEDYVTGKKRQVATEGNATKRRRAEGGSSEDDGSESESSDGDIEETGAGSESEDDGDEETSIKDSDGGDVDSDALLAAGIDDSDGSESDEGEKEQLLVGRMLEGRRRRTREQQLQYHREHKKELREELKAKRHGGKETNRAGISNRVAARNKPMAMLKQKREVRGKRTAGARAKLATLQKHVKTIKSSLRQKLRRR